jgi:hypothetical protein
MTTRKSLLAAVAAFALLAAPALAGNGHGGGNGNGGSHGNSGGGNGGGNSGKSGTQGNSGKSGTHGKSASAKSGKKTEAAVDDVEVAATPKEKNLHAKLGRLNSLQRNINAYMHSKSKNFAGVQAYVMGSAVAQNAQAAADAAAAAAAGAQAQIDSLKTELDALNATDQTNMTDDEKTALAGQIADVQSQIDAQQGLIDAAADAQAKADEAAAAVPSLDDALASMANKPVDDEVKDWATGVLADKIDQAAAKLAEEAPATP